MNWGQDLDDTLGEAISFVHACRLAAEGLREPRARNALRLMMDTVDERLNVARSIVDHFRDADHAEGAR